MTREEAIKYLIRPVVSSNEIGEIKQKELDAYNMAIEALSKPIVDITQRDLCADISCTDCPFMKETCKLMDYVASAEAVQGWIPCSERLPSESGTYLTTTAKGSVCTDHYYANSTDLSDRHWSYRSRREPIAWMPLPKPYREDGEQE